eukprot:CAMPEP_0168610214 /NCGR_PEP_ID=MMETSP0449_2-20121227/1661_1 /TAXON_ID=1082188 /ORGANISM="Strombidium rassoulzadegani, Strain ras09" /LENGTH=49 /DNA_ID=CAMNT_0008650491 /DNA_START=162 /DNA_END=311 /DNA_ORIENTATION=+
MKTEEMRMNPNPICFKNLAEYAEFTSKDIQMRAVTDSSSQLAFVPIAQY